MNKKLTSRMFDLFVADENLFYALIGVGAFVALFLVGLVAYL